MTVSTSVHVREFLMVDLFSVATAKFKTLFKLLFTRWRGSVFRLLWRDLLIFISIFFMIRSVNKFLLTDEQKHAFEGLVKTLSNQGDIIPVSFVLGFFVTNVMERWWDQFVNIPWPYAIAVYVSSTIHGYDEGNSHNFPLLIQLTPTWF